MPPANPDNLDFGSIELKSKLNLLMERLTYDTGVETLGAPGAASLTVRTHLLAVDGTDGITLAAPTFKGQHAYFEIISAANTPVSTVTVTGMRVSTQNVWNLDAANFHASTAPRWLLLYSPDGTAWDPVGMSAGVTVS